MWQPIETAPMDGTGILLYRRFEGKYLHLVDVGQFRKAEEGGPGWSWRFGFGSVPTHWQPLPEPPQRDPKGGRE